MSPFKSNAQRAKFAELVKQGKMEQTTFDEWQKATGDQKLPERVEKKPKARAKVRQVRTVRTIK